MGRHRTAAAGVPVVEISFPNRMDVWGRLCTHFEAAKVIACFSALSHVQMSQMYEKKFFFQDRKQEDLGREERIGFRTVLQDAGVGTCKNTVSPRNG